MRKLVITILSFVFGSLSVLAAGDVLSQLGVARDRAEQDVVWAFAVGQVPYDVVRAKMKAAAPAARAAIVEQVLAFAKSYASTPQFASAYAKYREEQKPEAPPASVDAEMKRRKAEMDAEFAEARKSFAELPPELRKEAEKNLKEAIEASRQLDTPEIREGVAQELAERKQQHQEKLAEWNEQYPANPRALIKKRLTQFLAETADVDYNARLVTRNGRQYFANEAYERDKPGEWKLAYRAGKEPTEKARAFARDWLAELK